MSRLTLESFVAFKPAAEGDGFEFYPQPRQAIKTGKSWVVTLGDVPLPAGIPAPENGLTVLYGFRDALDEMQAQHEKAHKAGMTVAKVTFHLDVDDIVMGTTNADSIGSTRFLNLRRLSKDLQQVVLDGVNALAAKEGKNAVQYERVLAAGQRPDLICRAIRAEPVFRHINSVVYMIPDKLNAPRGRQVATIFSSDVSPVSIRGDVPFQIVLPKLG